MPRLLVIGFGNPLRSDDAAGWLAARELSLEDVEEVRVVAAHQLLPEAAEMVSNAERVLFIDAARHGNPGEIVCDDVAAPRHEGMQSHELSPAMVLKLAEELYGKRPRAQLLTIAGANFETGETLSPQVATRFPELLKAAREWVQKALST